MKNSLKLLALGCLGLMSSQSVWALGTAAGVDITNTATAAYTVGTTPLTASSNPVVTTVDELLNVTAVGQDAGSQVTVASGAVDQVQTYLVTNTGNGTDSYSLTALNQAGDDFDTVTSVIYLDDGDGVFNASLDTLLDGSNDPSLVPDAAGAITVFVVSEMQQSLSDGAIATIDLVVDSNTAVNVPGTVVAGAGDGGTDAVVGSSGGTATATEDYIVSSVAVALLKSATIVDPFGGTEPVPGSTITYSIAVTVTGGGTATGVIISDPIPVNTTYVTSSMALDGSGLTDPVDILDDADFNVTTAGVITVNLGNLTAGTQTITFNATIN